MTESDVYTRKARKISFAAYALILGGLVLPILAAALGLIPARLGSYIVGRLIFLLVLGVIVAIVGFRRRSPTARAWAKLVVGVVLVGWAAVSSYSAWRADQAKERAVLQASARELMRAVETATEGNARVAGPPQSPVKVDEANGSPPFGVKAGADPRAAAFVRGALNLQKDAIAQFALLNNEFKSIDLSTALTPASLTNAAVIQTSRSSLQHLVSLIDKRDGLVDRYVKDTTEYFRTADIDETDRREATRSFEEGMPQVDRTLHELSTAQRASAASVSDMLDFAEANLGAIVVRNGKPVFRDRASLDRYGLLLGRVRAAAQREREVMKSFTALQSASIQWMKQAAAGG